MNETGMDYPEGVSMNDVDHEGEQDQMEYGDEKPMMDDEAGYGMNMDQDEE